MKEERKTKDKEMTVEFNRNNKLFNWYENYYGLSIPGKMVGVAKNVFFIQRKESY